MKAVPRVLLWSWLAAASISHATTWNADAAALRRTVSDHYYAIGENRLEEAMRFFHEDSPQADSTRRELEIGRSTYLQRTSTIDFDVIGSDGARAVAVATHRHLRIVGMKFMEHRVVTCYTFRRQRGVWKLWSSAVIPFSPPGRRRGGELSPRPDATTLPSRLGSPRSARVERCAIPPPSDR